MNKHWIDDADHYRCPICGFETGSPAKYEGCKCPKCGFQDEKDRPIHGKCNQCKYYEGVHNVQGHAPCSYHKIGGVLWNWYCSQFKSEVEQEPRKGRWVPGKELCKEYLGQRLVAVTYADWHCSKCNKVIKQSEKPEWNFCPYCGSDNREMEDK